MLTVQEAITDPALRGFRLVAGENGINNRIRNVRIFESEADAFRSEDDFFHPGDFVLTNLAHFRGDPAAMETALLSLLDKNLAALAIRDLFFTTLPPSVLKRASHQQTPIFFFSTAAEEIIFTVKSALKLREINLRASEIAGRILIEEHTGKEIGMLALKINPRFRKCYYCVAIAPRDQEHEEEIFIDHMNRYFLAANTLRVPFESAYTVLQLHHAIVVIYSDTSDSEETFRHLQRLAAQLPFDPADFSIGVSRFHLSLAEMGIALREAIYATAICLLDGASLYRFERLGFSRMLCPTRDNYWVRDCYTDHLEKILQYDRQHHANLFETMKTYALHGGDIQKTAKAMYQHSNTIRYRLRKIHDIMGIEGELSLDGQIYLLVRFYQLHHIMKGWMI